MAYPHLAKNPMKGLIAILARLYDQPLDFGSAYFSPSNFEVTSIDVGNPTTNVIPVKAEAMFNIRYNDRHSADSLQTKIRELAVKFLEPNGLDYDLDFEPPSQAFLTEPGQLDSILTQAVREITGITPSLATDGGTSDARFIKEMCPVVEFGLLTATIHKIDEQVSLADLAQLTAVYRRFLDLYFEEFGELRAGLIPARSGSSTPAWAGSRCCARWLRGCRRRRFVYLGDTARLPYGTKSAETVQAYALQATRLLIAEGVKMVVIACNTASAVALAPLAESARAGAGDRGDRARRAGRASPPRATAASR